MTEPTDRSTPRTSSTKVMPIAMTHVRRLRHNVAEIGESQEAVGQGAKGYEQDGEKQERREPQEDQGDSVAIHAHIGLCPVNPTTRRASALRAENAPDHESREPRRGS